MYLCGLVKTNVLWFLTIAGSVDNPSPWHVKPLLLISADQIHRRQVRVRPFSLSLLTWHNAHYQSKLHQDYWSTFHPTKVMYGLPVPWRDSNWILRKPKRYFMVPPFLQCDILLCFICHSQMAVTDGKWNKWQQERVRTINNCLGKIRTLMHMANIGQGGKTTPLL